MSRYGSDYKAQNIFFLFLSKIGITITEYNLPCNLLLNISTILKKKTIKQQRCTFIVCVTEQHYVSTFATCLRSLYNFLISERQNHEISGFQIKLTSVKNSAIVLFFFHVLRHPKNHSTLKYYPYYEKLFTFNLPCNFTQSKNFLVWQVSNMCLDV